MPPRMAEMARTAMTTNRPRRSGFMDSPLFNLKPNCNMTFAKCRLTPLATLSMMQAGHNWIVSNYVEHSTYDCGLPGGAGGIWTPEIAGTGSQLGQTHGGIPQGLRGLPKRF